MKSRFFPGVLLSVLISLNLAAQVPNRSSLIIRDFMANNFTGQSPSQFQWAPDSKYLYFQWTPDGKPSDSAWRVNPSTLIPERIHRREMQNLRQPAKQLNSAKTLELINKEGDYYLVSLVKKDTSLIYSTAQPISSVRFTHEGSKLVLTIENNLYLLDPGSGQFRQLTNFQEKKAETQERPSRNPEKTTGRDQWLTQDQVRLFPKLAESSGRRGTVGRMGDFRFGMRPPGSQRIGGPKPVEMDGYSVSNLNLTPDEKFVTFTKSQPAGEYKGTIITAYVTRSGYTETQNTRSKVGDEPGRSTLGIIDIDKDSVYELQVGQIPGITDRPDYEKDYPDKYKDREKEPRKVNVRGPEWSKDGKTGVISFSSADHKDFWLLALEPADGSVRLLDRQRDEAWIGGPGTGNMGWMPDGKRIWFQSEASGYSHLYWMNPETGEKKQLTSGNFEVYDPRISEKKKWWYFTSNEVHPGEHHFYRMPVEGGLREKITSLEGGSEAILSPDEKWLAIEFSTANRIPELYIQKNEPGAEAVAITDSRSPAFKAYNWRIPEFITVKATDGADIHARLYRPGEGTRNGAAVIFVHGAGYLQNAHKWWSTYEKEYMFHNMLVDNGYTVLDMDYRGSSGYGRDWRTGIYRHMGGKDLSDHVDGAGYLVKQCGVDPRRIGIYGGSYGGFITLMAMFNAPDVFAAGAGLRSVTDWAHYNHGYTANILNTPAEDSLAYMRSSPINFAEGLKGRLLMCHGVLDDNVHFQDIVRLSQRLIDLGKENWELAIYPLERHSFTDPDAWTDEYRRIFKLFQETLNPGA
jgi:dipeptidyl aminopeptidase/acylaminoacyl peptidase